MLTCWSIFLIFSILNSRFCNFHVLLHFSDALIDKLGMEISLPCLGVFSWILTGIFIMYITTLIFINFKRQKRLLFLFLIDGLAYCIILSNKDCIYYCVYPRLFDLWSISFPLHLWKNAKIVVLEGSYRKFTLFWSFKSISDFGRLISFENNYTLPISSLF